ncbi:MAG: hypothetical protein IJH36_00565 [Clostridia bacterium]|nr:hypothetical protein [Clostridia bacterium]
METIRLSPECISCLAKKELERYPTDTGRDNKIYAGCIKDNIRVAKEYERAGDC